MLIGLLALACAGGPGIPSQESRGRESSAREAPDTDRHYLRSVVFQGLGDTFLIHWGKHKMPLRVYLPPPPPGLFENPRAIRQAVELGVLNWTNVAGPGLPSFEFVDNIGDADIPILWAEEPDGNWYIAFCSYDVNTRTMRMGVSHILVTGRWGGGRVAGIEEIYQTVLHEMGHALGLGGHSPDSRDIMYYSIGGSAVGLSDADKLTLKKLYQYGSRRYSGRRSR